MLKFYKTTTPQKQDLYNMGYNTFIPIVTNGLVLCLDAGNTKSYPGSGTTWTDLTSNGNNGTLTNGPTFNSSNVGSIVFNGTTQYIDNVGGLSSFSFIQNTNIFSINFWFKTNILNTDQVIMGTVVTTSEKGFFIGFRYLAGYGLNGLGCYNLRGVGGSMVSIGATNDNIITDTNWHQACYVINNTTVGQWYVDGISVTTSNRSVGTTVDNVKSTGDSTRTLNIGRANYSSTSSPLNGNISLVQVYNRALSASEVLQNYNATKLRYYTHIDADAQRFIDATQITTESLVSAVNLLVIDLKTYGIWDKMKAIYPVVGGTAFTHKFNLKDPRDSDAAFRLLFTNASGGNWIHSSTGMTPNGTSDFANTYLSINSALVNNSTHISLYSRTENNPSPITGYFDMGVGVSSDFFDLTLRINSTFFADSYSAVSNRIQVSNSSSTGFFINTRTTSIVFKAFRNNIQLGTTNTNASSGYSSLNIPIFIGAMNLSGTANYFANRQYSFASIGDGLTDTEAANFYTAVQAYQTRLGRNV